MLRNFTRTFTSSPRKLDFARAQLLGRVGNFEFKESANGVPFANYSLAVQRGPKDQATTNWYRLSVFDEAQLSKLQKTLRVGNLLYVDARLQTQKYEDPETQKVSNRLSLVHTNFEIVNWGKKPEGEAESEEAI